MMQLARDRDDMQVVSDQVGAGTDEPLSCGGFRGSQLVRLCPLNSRLDMQLFSPRFGVNLPDWRVGVSAKLQMLLLVR